MAHVINIGYTINNCKAAKCRCGVKLVQGANVLMVIRAQGSFNSVSNYCDNCAEGELKKCMDEIAPLMQNIIKVQEIYDSKKTVVTEQKIDELFNEASSRFNTTLKNLD